MKTLSAIGLGLLLLASVAAQDAAKGDLDQVQGVWAGTFVEVDGKAPSAEEKDLRLTLLVTDDRYEIYAPGNVPLMKGTLKLDPGQALKTIDAVFGVGELRGLVQKGVYELKDDELTCRFGKPGDDRPRGLTGPAVAEESTIRYVRIKK